MSVTRTDPDESLTEADRIARARAEQASALCREHRSVAVRIGGYPRLTENNSLEYLEDRLAQIEDALADLGAEPPDYTEAADDDQGAADAAAAALAAITERLAGVRTHEQIDAIVAEHDLDIGDAETVAAKVDAVAAHFGLIPDD